MGTNTLTNLIGTIYNDLDVVSRELVGIIPAVTIDAQYSRAAMGQTVTSPVVPAAGASDNDPAATSPDTGSQVIGNTQMTISKSKHVAIQWTGEEQGQMNNNGAGYNTILSKQFQQAFRTLTNLIEADLTALHIYASRAFGSAGTNPFGTSTFVIDSLADVLKILKDNGAPNSELQAIINTSAGANLRKVGSLYKVNEAGASDFLRQGVLDRIYGFAVRESAAVETFTAGTNNGSATTDTTGYAVGSTAIGLASAGTGTIKAGDVITFAGDTNKYVVATGDTNVANGGSIVLQEPGLRVALAASAVVITTVATHAANIVFPRSAIALATRLPMRPAEGDQADDVMTVTDPYSGLSFEVAVYKQYRRVHYEVAIAWGVKAVKPAHIVKMLG